MMQCVRWTMVVAMSGCLVALAGCSGSVDGPDTVPVKGTLTIGGQPANDLLITLAPVDSKLQGASGSVSNGAFELVTGNQGKRGAMVGRYKVVLSAKGTSDQAAAAQKYSKGGAAASKSAEKKPFADKYGSAATSDKEVEVKAGANDLKIEIPSP